MPRGRVPVRGGVAWGRLSWKVSIRSLKPYRGEDAPDLSWRDARTAHKQIRLATKLYRLAHGGPKGMRRGSGPQTRTRIVEAVTRVKKNAAGVVRTRGRKRNWLDRLGNALAVPVNLLADLHRAMIPKGIEIWTLRRRLHPEAFSDEDLLAVTALAELDVDTVVPKHGHPNPPLKRLVNDLVPVWRSVTGTSAYPKTDHLYKDRPRYGDKFCPFADWVDQLVKDAGLRPPPPSTVARLVRLQKNRK